MATGVNKVILVGNLGKDPELKYGQASGKAVCRFSLAVTERWGGEDQTEWFNIVCFGRTAEVANEYLSKGRQVYLEGRLQTRKYQDKTGQDRYMTEVLVNNLTLLGRKDEGGGGAYTSAPKREEPPQYRPPAAAAAQGGAPPEASSGSQQRPARDDDPFSGDFGPPPSEDDMPF